MPAIKTGRTFVCQYCGNEFYRRGSLIKRGVTRSCGAPLCKSAAMSGGNNPFWGKEHTPEMKEKMSALKSGKPPRKYGPAKGSFRHTREARAKMSQSLREQWAKNREKRMANLPRGESHYWTKLAQDRRHRIRFTELQIREWGKSECAWCSATEDLVLDHVIPVAGGGQNRQTNAQTLCRPCNLWKAHFVDRPFLIASLDNKRG